MNSTRRNVKPRVDPAELSKKLLLDCNVTREKNKHIEVLHKGEGKMFFQSDK